MARSKRKSKGQAAAAHEHVVKRKKTDVLSLGGADDVYEAEDSDPDEEKHVYRYDKVDNYEYELPSDFEDEEIDEETAFTEQDKIRFAGMFPEEEEEEDLAEDPEDGKLEEDDLDDEEDELGEDEDEKAYGADEELEVDDLRAFGLDEDEEEAEDVERSIEEDEAYRNMLEAVVGKPGGRRSQPSVVRPEGIPESEFHAPLGEPGSGSGLLTIQDLVKGLGDARAKLGASRKLLDQLAKSSQPVHAPLPRTVKERLDRKAGYVKTSKDVSKWVPLVKANREAPTLQFKGTDEVNRPSTTAAIVSQFEPVTEMETEVAALLAQAGAQTEQAIQEAEEALALKELSLEEARQRRDRLAKMRSLLFYHELKAKRLKKIKSKEYHRKINKAAKRKSRLLGEDDKEAERKALEEAEYERAKERLTLRHKNTSRWARRALKRGVQVMDAGTKAAVAEQLQLGEQLRRKINRMDERDGDEDDDSTSASGDEEDGEAAGPGGKFSGAGQGRGLSSRAKALALDMLQGGAPEAEELPKKGLFSLPFMARALEKKRREAQEEAKAALREIEEEARWEELENTTDNERDPGGRVVASGEDDGETRIGRRAYGGSDGTQGLGKVSDEWHSTGGDLSNDEDEDQQEKEERLARSREGPGPTEQQIKQFGVASSVKQLTTDALRRVAVQGNGVTKNVISCDRPLTVEVEGLGNRLGTSGRSADLGAGKERHGDTGALLAKLHHHQSSVLGGRNHLFGGEGGSGQVPEPAQVPEPDGPSTSDRPDEQEAFISCSRFKGPRSGYVFKRSQLGLGYYLDDEGGTNTSVSKATRKNRRKQKLRVHEGAAASEACEDDEEQTGGEKEQAELDKGLRGNCQSTHGPSTSSRGITEDLGLDDLKHRDPVDNGDVAEEDDVSPGLEWMSKDVNVQQQLIQRAFAGDDVEAEFLAEKEADVAEELPEVETPSVLPGWGTWANQQREPRWMVAERQRAEKKRAEVLAKRRDARMKCVVISEKYDKKAAKYFTPQVPFPFDKKDVYEASIRQPLGRDFNPSAAFSNLTRPAVLKPTGVVIEPLQYSKPMAQYVATKGAKQRAVATVAAGKVVRSKAVK